MAKITDIIEEQGGEDDFVPPHKIKGAAAERFAELASTGQEPVAEIAEVPEAEEAPLTNEEMAEVHGVSVDTINALDEQAGYELEEAQAAIGIRYNEADAIAGQVFRGQLDAEGQSPETLAKVDALEAEEKRRAEQPKMIAGTMTERTDSLLGKATDVVGDVAEGAADIVRGVERSGWKKQLPLKINNAADTPETRLADEFYKYLAENKLFNKLGAISEEELASYIPTYLETISGGESTKATRLKWFDMVTRGIATRNGLSVMDMHLPQGLLEDGTAIDDLASGLTIYKKQSDGRIPTIRQDSEGNLIPFSDEQKKQIDSELEASGVYDPLVRSQYRTGYTKKKIESLNGLSYAWNWVDQARGYAFNKMGVGLETRHTDTSAAMAGEMMPIIMGGLAGGAPLAAVKGITQLGRLGTLVKVAAFESSMAVTEYYMAKKGDRQQSLEGAIQSMNLSEVEKENMGGWAFLHPVLKYVDAYAKDSQFVITGDDDADAAALKTMGSGLKAGGILTAVGFGFAGARMVAKPVIKKGAAAAVKGIKISEDAVRRAATELGLSADDAVRAFNMTLGGEAPQRGAVGGGKLPKFGRGADEPIATEKFEALAAAQRTGADSPEVLNQVGGTSRFGENLPKVHGEIAQPNVFGYNLMGVGDVMHRTYELGGRHTGNAVSKLENLRDFLYSPKGVMPTERELPYWFERIIREPDVLKHYSEATQKLYGNVKTPEEGVEIMRKALKPYVESWKHLQGVSPVNEASKLIQDLNIALAELRFDDARGILKDIDSGVEAHGGDYRAWAWEGDSVELDTTAAFNKAMAEQGLTPATRAGQEGFLSFPSPHDLLKRAKSFLENLKAVRTKRKNAELEADIKNTEEIIEQLEPSAGQVDSATYDSANKWNKALEQRIEAEKHLKELDGLPSEARIAELAKKHGTEADLGKLKNELNRKKRAAAAAEKSRRADFEEDHNINLDDWGDPSKEGELPRFDKKTGEGITLRDWLEGKGEETIGGGRGIDDAGEGVVDDLDIAIADEVDPIRKVLFEEYKQKKNNAIKAFLRAMNNYKNDRVLGLASKKESSRLEFYFVKLQQVLAEGDDLLDAGTRKGVFTQSYTTPKLKDDEALFKWSDRGYASGNLSARQIYNNANGYRRGEEFADEYGQKATQALEEHFNNTRMFKNRDIQGTGGRAVMATLRMAKVGSLVSSAGANIAALMGIPVVLARKPLQIGVETAISVLPRNPWTNFVNDARAIRQSTPEKKYAERIGRLEIDEKDGTSKKFWENALHFFFNPTSRRNVDLGGSRATGEYAAGYTGTLDVFGRESDIQSATPMAVRAMTTENKYSRNIKTALVGLWELLPREVMQRIDRTTKAMNFNREFSRQVSSTFHDAVGNTKRVKNGTLVNDKQVFEIYHIMLDAKKAIETGELEEHHMRKFLMDNLSHAYDDAPKGQIHSGYSNEELIDISMKAWNQTLDRQRELTLQQNLPLYGIGRGFEKATQDPTTGHFIMFGKTLGNNFSMGMERVPFFGAAWDIWGRKGGLKSMGKAQSLEVLEKQIVGGAMWGLGAMIYNKYSDRFEIDKDGDLLITVNVSYDTIRENLRMNLEENPDQLSEMMDAHNVRMTEINEIHGTSATLYDDPYKFLEEVGLGIVMPISEGEQGRAVIKAPRMGWLFTGVTSSIAFYKGMDSVNHLPLRVIREQGYGDKVYDAMALSFKQHGSSEIMDGAKKMAAMLTADEQTTVASVTDMVMGELASTTTPWAGAQKTGGEPFETVSELSRDYRAVGGLEEFMESGGKISIPSLMNWAFGDDHISKAYTGMMFNKQRSQREASSALLVEWKYETNFVDKQLRESGVVVRAIMDNEILKGAKDVKTYDYRDDDGKTAYEEILDMAHGVVIVNPNDASESFSYEVAMRRFFADPAFKKLQGAIDKGIKIEKDKVEYRDSTGAITNKDMLTALAAQEIVHTRVIKIRNAFKDVAVAKFMAEGKMETFKHKGNGASLGTQYSKVVAADFAGKIGLAEAFEPTRSLDSMSVVELQSFIQDAQVEQANAFAEFYMAQFEQW